MHYATMYLANNKFAGPEQNNKLSTEANKYSNLVEVKRNSVETA